MASETEPRLRWLFLDLNSYFASVEQELRPELRGRPVAVVPVMADTTWAIAASYEAKAFGVRTGTRVRDLCHSGRRRETGTTGMCTGDASCRRSSICKNRAA